MLTLKRADQDIHGHDRRRDDYRGTVFDQECRSGQRDPEMHQTRKGQQWYFGMKAHVGMDSKTKIIHAVVATAANVHDIAVLGDLLHGEEAQVWGTRLIAASAKSFANMRRAPRTSPTGATGIAAWWTRHKRRETAPNPGCGPRSSTVSR